MPISNTEFKLLPADDVRTDEESIRSSVKRQLFATIAMDLLAFSYGATCGWSSSSIVILRSEETPLDTGPLSTAEASWVVSGICIGGFVGNILLGWLATRIGQKVTLCVVAIPQMFGWLLIYYAKTPFYLILSRLISGFAGGGLYSIIPGYISEISDDAVRGTLGSTLVFACNLGLFVAYVFGEYVDYLTIPWLMVPVTLAFLLLFARIPDSPTFLAKRKLYDEAETSMLYFKNVKRNAKHTIHQIEDELQKLHYNSGNDDNSVTWADFTEKHARKAVIYGLILMALNQFCGCFAMLSFTATIFKESGSNLSPNISSIIVGGIQIIGSMFPTMLVDRLGRKAMMGISGYCTSFGLSTLGAYSLLKHQGYDLSSFSWLPLLLFSFTIFIANWGLMTLPFLIVSELTHPKIRGFVTIVCMSFLWICAFIALKYMSSLIEMFGMHGTMFVFAFNSLAGALFITICLPETNGKNFEQIMKLLEK